MERPCSGCSRHYICDTGRNSLYSTERLTGAVFRLLFNEKPGTCSRHSSPISPPLSPHPAFPLRFRMHRWTAAPLWDLIYFPFKAGCRENFSNYISSGERTWWIWKSSRAAKRGTPQTNKRRASRGTGYDRGNTVYLITSTGEWDETVYSRSLRMLMRVSNYATGFARRSKRSCRRTPGDPEHSDTLFIVLKLYFKNWADKINLHLNEFWEHLYMKIQSPWIS